MEEDIEAYKFSLIYDFYQKNILSFSQSYAWVKAHLKDKQNK